MVTGFSSLIIEAYYSVDKDRDGGYILTIQGFNSRDVIKIHLDYT